MTIDELIKKYGTEGISVLLEAAIDITRAPTVKLRSSLRTIADELREALDNHVANKPAFAETLTARPE